MFERLTEKARATVALAQEDARRFNRSYIGPTHLLLGLLRRGEGVAASTLSNLVVDPDHARAAQDAEDAWSAVDNDVHAQVAGILEVIRTFRR